MKNLTLLIDGRPLEKYVIRPSRLADGVHKLEIRAFDMAGHGSKLNVEFRTKYFADKYAQFYASVAERDRVLYLFAGLAVGMIAMAIIAMVRRRGR